MRYEHEPDALVRSVVTAAGEFRSIRRCEDALEDAESAWWSDFLAGGKEHPERQRGSVSVVDLFCGAGGLSLGANLAASALGLGVYYEFAADADPLSLGIYKANHKPRFATDESVANLVSYQLSSKTGTAVYTHKPRILDEDLELLEGSIDLLLAGPPCQGHSTANNKTRFNDPRNLLYQAVPAIAVGLGIPAVVIENVPGVTASREGVVKTTVELLESNGYKVTARVLKSDLLGWPQRRKRYFLVATLGWDPVPMQEIESALARKTRPISWALEDLLDSPEDSIMTEPPIISAENRRRIDFLHDYDLYDLPNSERPECHREGTTYRAVYGRLKWDEPAPTLTTGFMTPGRGRYVHPLRRRTLVPREAARLQGFPDSYRFEHAQEALGRSAIAKGIGDAVPSPLGFAAVLAALANRPL